MKNFTKTLAVLSFTLLLTSPVFAGSSIESTQTRSLLDSFTVSNNTGKDIAYRVLSTAPSDNLYGIKRGKGSVYHPKLGDSSVTFEVGECKRLNSITGLCVEFDASSVTNCVNSVRYDAFHIKSMEVNSLKSCIITCNDGTTTSCITK